LIFKRLALALAAAACLATAAAIALVALAFAFYHLLANVLPPAGAAACLFFVAAIVAALAGLILVNAAKVGRGSRGQGRGQAPGAPAGLVDGLADMVRDRPVAAAALAATVGWVLTRSPGLAGVLGTLISRQGRGRRLSRAGVETPSSRSLTLISSRSPRCSSFPNCRIPPTRSRRPCPRTR
jgi:hypothetical protein